MQDDGFIRPKDMAEQLLEGATWVAVGIADKDGYAASVAYCHPKNAQAIAALPEFLAALEKLESELADIDLPFPAYAREALKKAGYEF